MPQLRIIASTSRGGAEVWDEEVMIEGRANGIVSIDRGCQSDLVALAVGRAVWVSEKPQVTGAEYLIIGKDGTNTLLAQLKQPDTSDSTLTPATRETESAIS
jgi:hypothetical protein